MIDPTIETKISKFLQKNVSVFIEGHKPLKEGKFLIFRFKEFYFNLTIKSGNTSKVLELPYPFRVEESDTYLKFSYVIEDFSNKNEELDFKLKFFKPEKKNKFYNSTLVLSSIEI